MWEIIYQNNYFVRTRESRGENRLRRSEEPMAQPRLGLTYRAF